MGRVVLPIILYLFFNFMHDIGNVASANEHIDIDLF